MREFRREHIVIGTTEIHLIHFAEFEPTHFFHLISEQEQERLDSFHHVQRKREFVATRILKHDLFGYKEIEYESHGAPFIKNEGYISISHSRNCCGIAINENYKIGFDIEKKSSKAQKLHSKFIALEEAQFLDTSDELLMTKAWSCKEALYKLSGRKQLIFKTDLRLLGRQNNDWKCEIMNPSEKISVELQTFEQNDRILTINTGAIESNSH